MDCDKLRHGVTSRGLRWYAEACGHKRGELGDECDTITLGIPGPDPGQRRRYGEVDLVTSRRPRAQAAAPRAQARRCQSNTYREYNTPKLQDAYYPKHDLIEADDFRMERLSMTIHCMDLPLVASALWAAVATCNTMIQ